MVCNSQTIVNISGNCTGRIFEGVGILSGGGGNTKLLIDYPEPYSSQILNYLFKPKFGASFPELKVEIGGDMNSTSGTEPSHARTKAELLTPFMKRGYETWLIDQAKKRNPKIVLYGLEWGAPGWIGNIWSQNNADYLVSYIKGLKSVWGYDMDYIAGNQNESFKGIDPEQRNYIVKILRPTLDANGLSKIKIIAPDILSNDWKFANEINSDPELKKAVYALGYHYVGNTTTEAARNCGLPIWESEGWTGVGNWHGAYELAKEINLNYILGRLTKTDIWHLINSQYDNVNWPHSGVMEANSPWSGWYLVSPAVWAAAHTNQFAEPGWKYIDAGCDTTKRGTSYVTLKSPIDDNYSIIIVTSKKANDTITFNLAEGLSKSVIHVWRSTEADQFIKQADITPGGSSFKICLTAGAIYSLTTTTGQQKGDAGVIPNLKPFGTNYNENFDDYEIGTTPKYMYDYFGTFEVQKDSLKGSKVFRQIVTSKNLEWNAWGDYPPGNPITEFGDFNWQNYDYSTDVRIETTGSACIYGRLGQALEGRNIYDLRGYRLAIKNTGVWSLAYGDCYTYDSAKDVVLASGTIAGFAGNAWHNLKLSFSGNNIKAYIDYVLKDSVINNIKSSGMAGMGCGFNYTQFDNVKVTGKPDNFHCNITSGSKYIIINHKTGKVLSPLADSPEKGINIVQVPYTGRLTQQWTLTNLGNGYWSIKNAGTSLAMEIKDAVITDSALNVQNTYMHSDNQQWKLNFMGSYFNLINKNSEKQLDIKKQSADDNAPIVQLQTNVGESQQWELKSVEGLKKF